MKAFVKVNNGTFPNLNFYLAWEALTFMGYEVTLFEEKDLNTLEITPGTPVFAGVKIFRQVIDKLGVDYPEFDCYPKVLNPYYGRTIRVSTVGEERLKFDKNPIPVFVKPVKPKQFIGNVWFSILNLIPLANIPDETPCYVCEPIDIVSEFRVYVLDGEILGVKHYYGDWSVVPDKAFIKEVVKNYKPCPIAYGVDIGVTKDGASFVIEANDGCNLGNYGLDYIHFGEMLVSRWFEIMATHNVEEQFKKELAQQKYYDDALGRDPAKQEYRVENWYNKRVLSKDDPRTGKCLKVSSEMIKVKEKAMKSFAEDVQRRLRENEDIGIPEVNLELRDSPIVAGQRKLKANWHPEISYKPMTGRMRQLIGKVTVDRDEFWRMTDAERQALYDKHAPGTKAPKFDPRFAEKYGKNPEGPF